MCKGWIIGGDKSILLRFLMIIYFCSVCVQSNNPLTPALYVFGDSLLDSGNNNLLPTLARANFRPYGTDFVGGATGRFTNGRTVADFIAEHLGLPYSPPYMSFQRSSMVTTGLNYASGTCGILPATGKYLGNCLSLSDQIDLFQRTVEQDLPAYYQSPEKLSKYMSKSIFLVSIGSNDYINNYLQPNIYDSSRRYSPRSFAKLLIRNLSQQLQKLQNLGARKVVAFEIGPIGCIPWITGQYNHDGQCVEEINRLAIIFNEELGKMLENLTSTHQGSSFVLGHVHGLGYDAIINPSNYGLIDSSKPCCVTIWVNGTTTCIPELLPCTNTGKNYFWDGFHLTETVYSVIAKRCISDNTICVPKNIDLLVQV